MTKKKLIGGFFEMAVPSAPIKKNIAEHWKLPLDPALRFANARSALAALASAIQPRKAWVPAYICHSVIEAFTASSVPVFYYAVGDTLEPNVFELDKVCDAGDLVLAINYFGQAPSAAFRDFAHKREDLIFIEDCAQTIDSGQTSWGNWRLISPRKVVGVADGGYVIPVRQTIGYTLIPSVVRGSEVDPWLASLLRFEDVEELNNTHWHLTNQKRERTMRVSDARMSRLSYELLTRIEASQVIKQRKNNFTVLYKHLSHIAFMPISAPDFCPFGFPIRLACHLRTIVNDKLISMGLFPAVHWAMLSSPAHQFPKEHLLSRELLTLPCDHRYGSSEMEYLATNVLDILRKHA